MSGYNNYPQTNSYAQPSGYSSQPGGYPSQPAGYPPQPGSYPQNVPQSAYSQNGLPNPPPAGYSNQNTMGQFDLRNPDFLRNMSPMVTSIGGKMLEEKTSSWFSTFNIIWNSLKLYFAVNNSYILKKLTIILYPFLNKTWSRLTADEAAVSQIQSTHKFALPRDDINAPDLYIPLMSFASYILLVGLAKGVGGAGFTPELLMQTIWRCIFLQLIETFIIMFIVSLKQINAPFLDIYAYTGYKYLGLCINVLFRLFGYYIGLLSALYCSIMLAIFVLFSFRSVVPKTAMMGPKSVIIQLICAGLQFIVMLILCLM